MEIRRLRILDSLAAAMSQLHKFSYPEIGSLEFSSINGDGLPRVLKTIGPCNEVDEHSEITNLFENGVDAGIVFCKLGPFNTSRDYFHSLLAMQTTKQKPPIDTFLIGSQQLLWMMIDALPRSEPRQRPGANPLKAPLSTLQDLNFPKTIDTPQKHIGDESFVLAHPDLNVQNILISEDGTITAIPRLGQHSHCSTLYWV
jgi:hypothetical protein